MKGNYKEIRKSLAHIDGNDKMKDKTATKCGNILRGEIDSAIDSYVPMIIPYSGTLRYDMTLVLALLFFYINTCQFCYPFLLPLLGLPLAVRGKAKLKILALASRISQRF